MRQCLVDEHREPWSVSDCALAYCRSRSLCCARALPSRSGSSLLPAQTPLCSVFYKPCMVSKRYASLQHRTSYYVSMLSSQLPGAFCAWRESSQAPSALVLLEEHPQPESCLPVHLPVPAAAPLPCAERERCPAGVPQAPAAA